jgi:hypothetical protein
VWHGTVIQQRLDYLGVPFICAVCKETGHLWHQCNGVSKKVIQGRYDATTKWK